MKHRLKRSLCALLAALMIFGILAPGTLAAEYDEIETASAFSTVPMVSTGSVFTAALRNDGTVWVWGQIADRIQSTPVQVSSLNNVTEIASFSSFGTVALRSDGTVWIWRNQDGYNGPVTQVEGLTNVIAVAGAHNTFVALRSDGTVWVWGANFSGQWGNGTVSEFVNGQWINQSRTIPEQVPNLNNITAISAGSGHIVALRSDGTIWAWGSNGGGQLGDGTTTDRTRPVQVSNLNNVTAISARWNHVMALRSDGTVWVWGGNSFGQLGDGTRTNRSTPIQMRNLSNITEISAGAWYSAAVRDDGTVWGVGVDWIRYAGFASPPSTTTVAQIQGLSNITSVSASEGHHVAIRADGTVWAWGWANGGGELGDGTTDRRTAPVQVRGVSGQGFLNLGTAPVGNTPFADVRFSDWFHDAVVHVYGRDIMRGTSATAFSPNDTLTRAMVATILYRMAGEPPASFRQAFSDVSAGQWYSVPVTWANDAGIVQGVGGGRFSPNDRLTREQLSAMMHRYAVSRGYDVSVPANVTAPAETSGWAMEYVRWAVHNNFILTGSPGTHATRAETANFVFRFDVRYGR